jgi:adenine-specific DNA-methyltransferase
MKSLVLLDFQSAPYAQTIKYMGSKRKIARYILEMIEEEDFPVKSIFDGFSGSTYVSQYLSNAGFRVHSSDQAIWSKVLGECYLNSSKSDEFYLKIIDHLNSLKPKSGWYTENYGGDPKEVTGKKPWQISNTMKLDSIREEIDIISEDEDTKNVLLTSLMIALDKVDNTLGHYAAYLGNWSPRSSNPLVLELPKFSINRGIHKITQGDIFKTVIGNECDIAYFDPPYGSNNELMPPSRVRYNAYYHIWKSICLNDKPELFGVNGRRSDSRDEGSSIFEEFRTNDKGKYIAVEAIEKLIKMTPNKIVMFSYSSGGRATKEQLLQIFEENSNSYKIQEISHGHNVMKNMSSTGEFLRNQDSHKEFLIKLNR